ncbi:hypothetical protein [Chlorogloea sp. CCALA 695]|uniref:hypothetical protein n=1 Tax=Chlorogloea sp. CCALA 695 TaxID=2107693 RepID=UPI001E560EC1|nr:hypothetical protein [Chlorogloea sp. CCALA 695]
MATLWLPYGYSTATLSIIIVVPRATLWLPYGYSTATLRLLLAAQKLPFFGRF